MDQPPALPRRVAWFAPWTWSRRAKWGIACLALLAYPLSSPVAIYTVWKLEAAFPGVGIKAVAAEIFDIAYAPVRFLLHHCPPFARLHEAVLYMLLCLFGVP